MTAEKKLLELLEDENPNVQGRAIVELGKLQSYVASIPISNILRDKTRVAWLRISAATSLGEIEDEQAFNTLVEEYLDVSDQAHYYDETVRSYAAQALSKFGEKALPLFLAQLQADNLESKQLAAKALGKIGDKQAVNGLVQLINDSDFLVRLYVIQSLASLTDPITTSIFLSILNDTTEREWIRWAACVGLAKLGDRRSVDYLILKLKDARSSSFDRANAAFFLGQLKDKRGFEPLLETIRNDHHGNIVAALAQALAGFGDEQAISVLRQAQNNVSTLKIDKAKAFEAIDAALKQFSTKNRQSGSASL